MRNHTWNHQNEERKNEERWNKERWIVLEMSKDRVHRKSNGFGYQGYREEGFGY